MRGAIAIVTLVLIVIWVSEARAQTLKTECYRGFVGAVVGAASNGDRNGTHGTYPNNSSGGALDLAVHAETRLSDRWGVRLEAGTVSWPFQARNAWGVPTVRDDVRITRATVMAVRNLTEECGRRIRAYAGLGAGAYRYTFDAGGDSTRAGISSLIGFDFATNEHVVVTSGVGFHAIRGTDTPPVFSHILFVLQASVGLKVRF